MELKVTLPEVSVEVEPEDNDWLQEQIAHEVELEIKKAFRQAAREAMAPLLSRVSKAIQDRFDPILQRSLDRVDAMSEDEIVEIITKETE
jgi:hypothetical protein